MNYSNAPSCGIESVMSKLRTKNERVWQDWRDLPDGVRRYWIRRAGRHWGWQILFKEVIYDAHTQLENTIRMWQEIYDNDGTLVEVHQKYPADTGHQKL
jgi:hypothetical protein